MPLNTDQRVAAAVPTLRRDDDDEYAAVVNSPVQMSCEASGGVPRPVITWYKDGVELARNGTSWSSEAPAARVLANGALRIDRVSANDSGTYRCVATNAAGSASRHVTLSVHGLSPARSSYQGRILDFSLGGQDRRPRAGVGFWRGGRNPFTPGRGSRERCELTQRGSGQSFDRPKFSHYFQHSGWPLLTL